MPYKEVSDSNFSESNVTCPHCGELVPHAKRCPNCGQFLPKREKKKWKIPKMTPVEIFLAILGFIMLMVGLVAV